MAELTPIDAGRQVQASFLMNVYRLWFWISLFIFTLPCTWAQDPSFRAITTEQGLPSNEVYALLEDDKGFIWIGCDAGLFRYDGVRFVAYRCVAQKSKSVTGLCKSPNGYIYCYNFVGQVFCVKDNQMTALEGLTDRQVANVVPQPDNTLWIATSDGILYYKPGLPACLSYTPESYQQLLPKQFFLTRASIDQRQDVWFMDKIVVKIDTKGTLTSYKVSEKQGETIGNYLVFSQKNDTYLMGYVTGNLYKIVDNIFQPCTLPAIQKALKGKKITQALKDKQDKLWITTFSGVIVYDFDTNTAETILEYFSFSHFLEDKEGAFWLSTLYDGLVYIPNFEFKNWHKEIDKILALDSRNKHNTTHIYFGNTKGELGILDTKSKQIQKHKIPNVSDIRMIKYDSLDKAVYFNANSFLYKISDDFISKIPREAGSIKDFKHLPEGYFFATSYLSYFTTDFEKTQAIKKQWGRAIAYNPTQKIVWIATNKGLLKVIKQDKEWIVEDIFWQDKQILALAFDTSQEILYVVDFEGKAYKVRANDESNSLPTPLFGLPENVQTRAILLINNHLIFATNQGLWFWAVGRQGLKQIGKLEGLVSEDVHSITFINDNIWLGTTKGLQNIPFPKTFKYPKNRIFLKEINAHKNKITDPENLRLNHHDELKISVESVCYLSADKFRYAYKLNERGAWEYLPANTPFIYIPSLPVGKFRIIIKMIDHQNRDSINTLILQGEVLPPFWQTWWFLSVCALFFLMILYAILRQVIYYLKQKQTREMKQIALENDLKLWQQTALQTQMNPHFLFNVLNSIKTYIYENEKAKAALYLNNFASLVRKVLQHSSQKKVSLAEEIEALRLYIELEAMLLEENFSYAISVAESLEKDAVYLPTFLLQPFVENAFKHGLRHKKDAKVLKIYAQMTTDDILLITIEDNGIGRQASHKINQKNKHTHESFATKNIRERINLLNERGDFSLSTEIIDLKNEEAQLTGTKVILQIQYNS